MFQDVSFDIFSIKFELRVRIEYLAIGSLLTTRIRKDILSQTRSANSIGYAIYASIHCCGARWTCIPWQKVSRVTFIAFVAIEADQATSNITAWITGITIEIVSLLAVETEWRWFTKCTSFNKTTTKWAYTTIQEIATLAFIASGWDAGLTMRKG